MKRLLFIAAYVCTICVLSGCDGFYQAIEKDTVMVKHIAKDSDAKLVEYNGMLSQETVTRLSINAVNKFYHLKLTSDQVRIGIYSMSQKELENLLAMMEGNYKNYENFKAAGEREKKALKRIGKRITQFTDGLTFVSLQGKTDQSGFEVLMNPKDGKVESIMQRGAEYFNDATGSDMNSKMIPKGLSGEEMVHKAEKYLAQIEGTAASAYQLDYQYSYGTTQELYYRTKEPDVGELRLVIDTNAGEFIGFDKDNLSEMWFYNN
ncbi:MULTISPECIES: hypothetical protein [Paenibacillus]|uniref:Uncharacterized protein n=1 Tax=Paenibacillus albilobatus TaxID=2716884 RepID=A0A920CCC8_9BACL|nr:MULTISPECIES: hypothetical protein [Paenibacillus]GIO34420.1 hypothetical protein J2TS6_55610 [Paenibacillus albilobatus]